MRRFILIGMLLVAASAGGQSWAATYKLANGQEVNGEMLPTSATDQGVQIKVGDGQYERVLWGNFSQEDLKQFAQNPKLLPFVEPFIEITAEEKIKRTEVPIKEPTRLQLPASGSLFKAMFASGLGLFLLALVYAANIYAGYEVALFRAQPPVLVAGLSAIPLLGFVAPIVFLAMPTRMKKDEQAAVAASEGAAAGAATGAEEALNPMQDNSVQHPSLHLAHEEKSKTAGLPEPQIFQRGQFTFNRRFFETRFSGFFGVVRREADKDMVFVVKSARGQYTAQRISRIAANDMHIMVHHGPASEEVMVPFMEVQEVRIVHKNSIK